MGYFPQSHNASLVTAALAAVLGATSAHAGGFAVREQSTEFQGMSFAGNAASGGGLSSMFWNPATAARAPSGLNVETHAAGIMPSSEITGTTSVGGVVIPIGDATSGDFGKNALVPSSYMTYRLSPELVAGLSVNAPFGLATEPSNHFWSGQTFARTSQIKTFNVTPTIGYAIAPWISIGAGLQLSTINATLKNASGVTSASPDIVVDGNDRSLGWTAGIDIVPMPGTSIGLGYRSAMHYKLKGDVRINPFASPLGFTSITAETTLPETMTASFRHALSPQLALLGTVEWARWSRLEKLDIICSDGPNPIFCPLGAGQLVRSLDLGWHDGWFFALGGEYKVRPDLTLRTGIAYELSPIQEATERTLRVPDADRIWASIGLTYKVNELATVDLAYTHIWGGDAPIDRTESGLRFLGNADDASVDIVSASLKIRLGGGAPVAAPLK